MPAFQITDAQRDAAIRAAEIGLPMEEICRLIVNPDTGKPVDKKTLLKHMRGDMEYARAKRKLGLGERCFEIAHSNRHKDSGSMAKFLAQVHLDWKVTDKRQHEFLDKDGNPTMPMLLVVEDGEEVDGDEALARK